MNKWPTSEEIEHARKLFTSFTDDFVLRLGLDECATLTEIKNAFRSMAKKYHPDKSVYGDEEMMKEFSVQVRQYNNDIKIVDIFGIFDCYTANTIRQKFQKLVQEGNCSLLANLAHVEFMNIKAIRVLVSIAGELRKRKREMKVCSLPERVERLFNLIGVGKVLPMYKNEQEALRHFIRREG